MTGSRVVLAPLRHEDSRHLLRWINDRELVTLSAPFHAVGDEEHTAWFAAIRERDDVRIFGIRESATDRLVGSCQLLDISAEHGTAELRIRLGEREALGLGYGTDAVRALCAFGFGELGLRRIALHVLATNTRAIRTYEKSGFTREGVLRAMAVIEGESVDVVAMARLADDTTAFAPPDAEDFTICRYSELIAVASQHYRFEQFGTVSDEPHVLWRHDVDMSMQRAVRLAEIEHAAGVRATYFLYLHSPFYNILEAANLDLVQRIAGLGHWLGLHFDATIEPGRDLEESIVREASILEDVTGRPVGAFSFHNPGEAELEVVADEVGRLVNAYGQTLRDRYEYVSDSNGYWRFARLPDVVAAHAGPRLHVLTHPEWWQDAPMSPRQRVERCAQGRAVRALADYDAVLAEFGRRNIR